MTQPHRDVDQDEDTVGLSAANTIRVLRAKLKAQEQDIEMLSHKLSNKERDVSKTDDSFKDLRENLTKETRLRANAQAAAEKFKKLLDEKVILVATPFISFFVAYFTPKASALVEVEKTMQAMQREAASASREHKSRKAEQETKDAKLNRALEEIDRLKAQLKSDELNFRETLEASKQEKERLVNENRRLSKHRSDLVTAFKKQMKLIDVLKRQKLHLEAAKMLSFTEEEFAKTLEYGDM